MAVAKDWMPPSGVAGTNAAEEPEESYWSHFEDGTEEAPPESSDDDAHASGNPWSSRLATVDASWLVEPPPPRRYLVRDTRTGRGAMPAKGTALFVAAGGAGKSFATVDLTISVVTCLPWLGVMQPETAGRVLLVTAEEPKDELRTRIYHIARTRGVTAIPEGSIDIVDIHDVHMPLLTPEAVPTEMATALIDLVRERGPYALVVIDPFARVSGASIDGDNVAACALVTVCEAVATAASGLVLGVHHTSQTARRAGLVDATAIRGATALGDSARLVMVLTVETVKHDDPALNERLGEIITVTRAKANHVSRWDPIQARRGEHGVLIPLDDFDLQLLADARRQIDPSSKKRADRETDRAAKAAQEQAARATRVSDREAQTRERDALDDAAAREIIAAAPDASIRTIVASLKSVRACGSDRAHAAVHRVRGEA